MSHMEIKVACISPEYGEMGIATFPDEIGAFETVQNWVLDAFSVEARNEEGQVIIDLVMEDLDEMVAEVEALAADIPGAIARGDLIPIEEFLTA